MTLEKSGRATRRRGQELEDALVDAAWAELVENGFAATTIEAVAARAGTSRAVVYRRWPDKRALALAVVRAKGVAPPFAVPDTGSLRGDLLALLRRVNTARAETVVLMGSYAGELFRELGITPAAAREVAIGDRGASTRLIADRAVARGEVDAARATPRAVQVAADLWRHDVLMHLRPLTDDEIVEIVDEVALPLLTGAPPAPPNTSA